MAVNLHRLGLPLSEDVGALVTSFLEIAPGVADTKKSVEKMLAYVVKYRGAILIYDGPALGDHQHPLRVQINTERRRNRHRMLFRLSPALRCEADYYRQKTFFIHRYEATTTGMLQGLAEVKSWVKVLKRVPDDPPRSCKRQRRGGCPHCALSSMLDCDPGACRVCGDSPGWPLH
jgi:hypothetical protein